MNKLMVYELIVEALQKRFENAKWAAGQAYEAATSKESVAENKYDTFGLEASYLAHGQSLRVIECESDYAFFVKNKAMIFSQEDGIKAGALVCLLALETVDSSERWFFLSSIAGGLSVSFDKTSIFLITPHSPVGLSLLNRFVGDEVILKQSGKDIAYEITRVL